MPNFVKTTSLWRTANLSNRNPINPVFVATLPGYVPDQDAAMIAWAAQGGSPPADQTLYGAFELRWVQTDMRVYMVLGQPMVTRVGGLLCVDADIWETKAQHDAPLPPLIQETLVRQKGDTIAEVVQMVIEYLVRATTNGYSGDRREPRANVTTDPAFDPAGVLSRPQVQNLAGQVLNRP